MRLVDHIRIHVGGVVEGSLPLVVDDVSNFLAGKILVCNGGVAVERAKLLVVPLHIQHLWAHGLVFLLTHKRVFVVSVNIRRLVVVHVDVVALHLVKVGPLSLTAAFISAVLQIVAVDINFSSLLHLL